MLHFASRWSIATLVLVGAPLIAQSSTAGSLAGVVQDKVTGGSLVGVTVKLTSTQITRTAVTGADGSFRFPLLNPGPYVLTLAKNGFATIQNQRVEVLVNETKQLSFKMASDIGMVVDVIAAPAIAVDTTSTQSGATMTMESLKGLPMGRSVESVTFLAPSVNGGGMGSSLFGASISGASGAENAYVVDGVTTTDVRYGGSSSSLVVDFLDQVEVQTGGFKPEFSALGGVVNAITKSGTNLTKGSAWMTFDPKAWAARPKRDEYVTQANPLDRWDVGGEISGPLVKDKVFYFVGVSADITMNKATRTNYEGFQGSSVRQSQYQFVSKVNWYLNQDLQLTFFGMTSPYKYRNDRDVPDFGSANTGYSQDTSSTAWNIGLDWTLSSSMYITAKLGRSSTSEDTVPVDARPAYYDYVWYNGGPGGNSNVGAYQRGGAGFSTLHSTSNNDQFKLDFTYIRGSHQIKAGFSMQDREFWQNSWSGDAPKGLTPTDMGGSARLYATYIRYQQVAFFNALSRAKYNAVFLQDTWDATSNLKMAFGFRAEDQALIDSNGVRYLDFGFKDQFQPRIGVIWDIAGDGKSKASINYAKYNEVFPLRYGLRYRGGRYIYYRTFSNAATGGYDYNKATGAWSIQNRNAWYRQQDNSTPYNDPPVQDGIKAPTRTEYTAVYEKLWDTGWMVGLNATYRRLENPIEDTTPVDASGTPIDPGKGGWGQALLANPRPGLWTWKTNAVSDLGPNKAMSWDSTYPEAYNTYKALTLQAKYNSSQHTLNVSYTWSRLEGNYEGVVSAFNQQIDTNGTSAFDYPLLVGSGLLFLDRTHVLKVSGSHRFPMGGGDLNAGYRLTVQSGTPLSQYTGGGEGNPSLGNWTITPPVDYTTYGDIPVDFRLGQFGRGPTTSTLDLHLDYAFKFGKLRLMPSLDIMNALNSRKATRLGQYYAYDDYIYPDWGKPTAYQYGTSYRVGLKLSF